MKIKKEQGFTGIDISIAVIILFIFISIIATLSYQVNSTTKAIERRGEAIEIAIQEIEKVKNQGFSNYDGIDSKSKEDKKGNSFETQSVEGKQGFYKTITVNDYTEIEGNSDKIFNVVKKVTVSITYKSQGKEQKVELSTILSKES